MYKKCFTKKGLALVTIALFIGMSAISEAGDVKAEKNYSSKNPDIGVTNYGDDCVPTFIGNIGEHGWYISDVSIGFDYTPRVDKIWYKIDGDWERFYTPFLFKKEGAFMFDYKWEYLDGNTSNASSLINFNIDKTSPTITLEKTTQMIRRKIIFTANANDAASGVERVEFYLDGVLKENITSGDYEYIYTWEKGEDPGEHEVNAIVYDNAGHSNSDDSDTTSLSYQYHATILSRILQRMQSISQLFLQLLKIMVRFPFHW